MACLSYEIGNYPSALRYYQHSLDSHGPQSSTYYNMAFCSHLLGQTDEARHFLEKVLQLDPGNEQAKAILGEFWA
jgi:tetratricopeptide (TPR) repeat protein